MLQLRPRIVMVHQVQVRPLEVGRLDALGVLGEDLTGQDESHKHENEVKSPGAILVLESHQHYENNTSGHA